MNYGQFKTQIEGDLNRPDLSAQVSQAVVSAIRFYEVRNWSFNSERSFVITSDGQANYAMPSDFVKPVFAKIKRGGTWFTVDQKQWAYIEEIKYDDTTTSLPRYYALYDDQVWLYPIPDQSMTLDMAYVKKLPALAADGDESAWIDIAGDLIRARAEVYVNERHIRGQEAILAAQVLRAAERDELDSLERRYGGRILSGRLRRRGVFWDDT